MELKIAFVNEADLSSAERIILALRRESFGCSRRNGVLKINKELPNAAKLAEIAKELWQYTVFDIDNIHIEEAICDQAEALAGPSVRGQMFRAWSECVCEWKREQNQQAAREWYRTYYDAEGVDALDAIPEYDPGFMTALWSEAHEEGKKRNASAALFLWAYQLGQAAGNKAGDSADFFDPLLTP